MCEDKIRLLIRDQLKSFLLEYEECSEESGEYRFIFTEAYVEQCVEKMEEFAQEHMDIYGASHKNERTTENTNYQIRRGFEGITKYVKDHKAEIAEYINANVV